MSVVYVFQSTAFCYGSPHRLRQITLNVNDLKVYSSRQRLTACIKKKKKRDPNPSCLRGSQSKFNHRSRLKVKRTDSEKNKERLGQGHVFSTPVKPVNVNGRRENSKNDMTSKGSTQSSIHVTKACIRPSVSKTISKHIA